MPGLTIFANDCRRNCIRKGWWMVDAFCEHRHFRPRKWSGAFRKARELGLPVKLHAEQLTLQHGAALAARYHALSADHLEYLCEEDIAAMARHGTVAARCRAPITPA